MPVPKQAHPLQALAAQGQSIWLDHVSRELLTSGQLRHLIEEDAVTGVTSNPSIFAAAIGGSDDYDDRIAAIVGDGGSTAKTIYEDLAMRDIREAAHALRPVYDRTERADGYVSIEVSPYLAHDAEGTVEEALRLWRALHLDIVMIKVPATEAGLVAIERLTAHGVNLNVTLLFSPAMYERVARAWMSGLETFVADGGDASRVASVASVFISRLDAAIAKALTAGKRGEPTTALAGAAIDNAKGAYAVFRRLMESKRWQALAKRGAMPQRLLWASTATKDPKDRDTLYMEELIGPHTVTTVPPATLEAFWDHGIVEPTLDTDTARAESLRARMEEAGLDLDAICARLLDEGLAGFSAAFDGLLGAVAVKRERFLGNALPSQTLDLPSPIADAVAAMAADWTRDGASRRLWAGDADLWTGRDEASWLGWLTAPDEALRDCEPYLRFAETVRDEGFKRVVLLGMGGSSLGPEVIHETTVRQPGFPSLIVLDSTDPAQIALVERCAEPASTLFLVASKSGSTLEPNVLRDHFMQRATADLGTERAARHFVAITDPGSRLEREARADGYRAVWSGDPKIGGRFSVLSPFGLVPAAATGTDVRMVLRNAVRMARSCDPSVPAEANPGVMLGLVMAACAKAGRDKLTLVAGRVMESFGAWVEQLVAESTGKGGQAIIPIDEERLGDPSVYGDDRVFVHVALAHLHDEVTERRLRLLAAAGHPVVRIRLADPEQVGTQFFQWEMATAVAGAVMKLNPFDQPDVEAAKDATRAIMEAGADGEFDTADTDVVRIDGAGDGKRALALSRHFENVEPGDYVAIAAFCERSRAVKSTLQRLRRSVRDGLQVATTLGFGPRFLHSTGQAHKGGANNGVFLQVTCDDAEDIPVPGTDTTFGAIKAAQAAGDLAVLAERGRRILRVHISGDLGEGLEALADLVERALCDSALADRTPSRRDRQEAGPGAIEASTVGLAAAPNTL